MVLLDTHPDYMSINGAAPKAWEYPARHYLRLLEYVRSRYAGKYWHALPREIAKYLRGSALNPNSEIGADGIAQRLDAQGFGRTKAASDGGAGEEAQSRARQFAIDGSRHAGAPQAIAEIGLNGRKPGSTTNSPPPLAHHRHKPKIWIDLDNTPHVPFFEPILEELQARNYPVLVTARDGVSSLRIGRQKRIALPRESAGTRAKTAC